MSGRRCGDLGERCKRSQRLQLDLACGPRCICCKHAGSGRATPARTCPRPPSRAIEREACLISFHVLMLSNINRTSSVGATFGLNSTCNRSPLEGAAGECGSGYALRAQTNVQARVNANSALWRTVSPDANLLILRRGNGFDVRRLCHIIRKLCPALAEQEGRDVHVAGPANCPGRHGGVHEATGD